MNAPAALDICGPCDDALAILAAIADGTHPTTRPYVSEEELREVEAKYTDEELA